MKICYVGDAGSIHTQKWVNYFAGKGHKVCLISPRPFGGNGIRNVKLHVLKMINGVRFMNVPLVMIQIARIINRENPDILHAHQVTQSGFWCAMCGFHPYVLTAWGSDIVVQPQKSKLIRWKATFALKRADVITCDAQHMADRMVEMGVAREKIKLIYFGVDTEKFSAKKRDAKIKEKLNIASDSPVVISLRGMSPIYDLESLVKAAPLVLEKVPEAKFLIAGDGEQRSYLENLATSLAVFDSMRFVGLVSNNDIPRYLASSDVYVSTSLSDAGLAASTAEAMACELPAVVTDFGDNSQWVKDGHGGFVVPLKSPSLLAERIVHLLKNEDIRRKYGKFNREVIEERNDYNKEMGKVEHLYQTLTGEK
ncbi:MAG: glycosyltransferase family 4 protein [Syntrophales bacterium]|nr:glycosyltransferase family 4 protein [Syntrophales bacterium]